jgi:hypothetical protein
MGKRAAFTTTPDKVYSPHGVLRDVFTCKWPRFMVSGSAGTGKTRALLEKCHIMLLKYPMSRGLMVRKTRNSMTETCMLIYESEVLHDSDKVRYAVQEQKYVYPNGSEFVTAGMDDPTRIMSGQYDFGYAVEATELALNDWEYIGTRMRSRRIPYQQLFGDCNPGPPDHWIMRLHHSKKKDGTSKLPVFYSTHKDNPVFWDREKNCWTADGQAYYENNLEPLIGVNYQRLALGLWVAAEGTVYDEWRPDIHIVDVPDPLPGGWRHYWTVDFGFKDPFVWQHWVEDLVGNLFLVEEIYKTHTLVEDHCEMIRSVWVDEDGKPKYYPTAVICDHDAEGRAVIERHLGLLTLPAYKAISEGVDATKVRLRNSVKNEAAGDMLRQGLYIGRNTLIHQPDELLLEEGKPAETRSEMGMYVWDKRLTVTYRDQPEDKNNHGMDAMRYMVAFNDSLADDPQDTEFMIEFEDRVEISPY